MRISPERNEWLGWTRSGWPRRREGEDRDQESPPGASNTQGLPPQVWRHHLCMRIALAGLGLLSLLSLNACGDARAEAEARSAQERAAHQQAAGAANQAFQDPAAGGTGSPSR